MEWPRRRSSASFAPCSPLAGGPQPRPHCTHSRPVRRPTVERVSSPAAVERHPLFHPHKVPLAPRPGPVHPGISEPQRHDAHPTSGEYASAHQPSSSERLMPPLTSTFMPLVPHASQARSAVQADVLCGKYEFNHRHRSGWGGKKIFGANNAASHKFYLLIKDFCGPPAVARSEQSRR
jgi:hypothetical protein